MHPDFLVEQRYRERRRDNTIAILVAIIIFLVAILVSTVMATESVQVDHKEQRHLSIVESCRSAQPQPDWCREYLVDMAHGRRERGVIPCTSDTQCMQLNPHLKPY